MRKTIPKRSHNFTFSIRDFVKLELEEPTHNEKMNRGLFSIDPAQRSKGNLFSYKKTKVSDLRK